MATPVNNVSPKEDADRRRYWQITGDASPPVVDPVSNMSPKEVAERRRFWQMANTASKSPREDAESRRFWQMSSTVAVSPKEDAENRRYWQMEPSGPRADAQRRRYWQMGTGASIMVSQASPKEDAENRRYWQMQSGTQRIKALLGELEEAEAINKKLGGTATATTSGVLTTEEQRQVDELMMKGSASGESISIPADLRKLVTDAGQAQVFEFVDNGKASAAEAAALVAQLQAMDLERCNRLFKAALEDDAKGPDMGSIEPLASSTKLSDASKEDTDKWYAAGLDAIAKGEVAAMVLSGGQGTRLGFAGPKGMYDIGLPSGKTLFNLFGERLLKLGQLAAAKSGKDKVSIPWYIMTSPMNDQQTREYFKEKNNFGLDAADVIFFAQGTLPCFTPEGKMMLESKGVIGQASDGNGGIYQGLKVSGSAADMKKRGIKYVHTYSVDNAICKVADPHFMGFCISEGADCGNKVVWKANPKESVGVVAQRGGKSCVIEYSEMPEAISKEVDANGKLVYGASNICNHFFTTQYLERVTDDALTFHVAKKAIPYVTPEGETVKPKEKNGIKLECFIFDPFYLSNKMAVLEGERPEEFTPVKNAPGNPVDSPDSARAMIAALHTKWIVAAGGKLTDGDKLFEISPLVSYGGEGLEDQAGLELDLSSAAAGAAGAGGALHDRLSSQKAEPVTRDALLTKQKEAMERRTTLQATQKQKLVEHGEHVQQVVAGQKGKQEEEEEARRAKMEADAAKAEVRKKEYGAASSKEKTEKAGAEAPAIEAKEDVKEDAKEEAKEEVKEEVAAEAEGGNWFTLDQLKAGEGPTGPDRCFALSDADFETHFKCTKDIFRGVPAWKGNNQKKALGLF
jgi:UDP-N-acetylglucosamine/UDP-N-acetylgalactosamine diphosphorylase